MECHGKTKNLTMENQMISEYLKYFPNDTVHQDITNEQLEKYMNMKEIVQKYTTPSKADEKTWNYVMIKSLQDPNTVNKKQKSKSKKKVKVAIIDSGINFTSDIDVCQRKNFIPRDYVVEKEMENGLPALYEDLSGHGTAVAGIIAAKENGVGITGINPNVEIYSARVLTSKGTAPIKRVVKAMEWAIQKEVNIINISFTTKRNSKELEKVIKKAYNKGILLVAAAGNKGELEYPAAYDEVISVGSVASDGNISRFSPLGCEIVAPGEKITSTDVFNTVSVSSGTSLAAPHIVGIASRLWEKDLSCSSDFIRCVLDISANLYGSRKRYGYGLVDYKYAEKIYRLVKPIAKNNFIFEHFMKFAIDIKGWKNTESIPVYNTEDIVEGAWMDQVHHGFTTGGFFEAESTRVLFLVGCTISDRSNVTQWNGMYAHPLFHGYPFWKEDQRTKDEDGDPKNYLAGYIYLTNIADAMVRGAPIPPCPELLKRHIGLDYIDNPNDMESLDGVIDRKYLNKRAGITWEAAAPKINSCVNQITGRTSNCFTGEDVQKGIIMYGMAMHVITDLFAHGCYYLKNNQWRQLKHGKNLHADRIADIPERYYAAEEVAKNFLSHLDSKDVTKGGVGSIKDLCLKGDGSWYGGNTFRLGNLFQYAKQIIESEDELLLHGETFTSLEMAKLNYLGHGIRVKQGQH